MTQVITEFFKGLPKAIVLGTRSGGQKISYRHFQVIKPIWGGSPNVESVAFGIDSIIEDLASR